MRTLTLISLFFVSINLLTAQPHSPRTFVLITDFGQLYSSYDWKKSDVELTESLGKILADEVMAGSIESAWPEGIRSVLSRVENRSLMAFYRVYYITTLKNTVVILGAKANENRHMPENMQSEKDIFFVVGHSGVDLSNVKKTTLPATLSSGPDNFSAQLSEITADFANLFSKTTGNIHETEGEDDMIFTYDSRVDLEGTSFTFLIEDMYASSVTFHAEFPASTDFDSALKSYRKVIQLVEASNLACCIMKKDAEYVNSNNNMQNFRLAEQRNKADNKYLLMNIVVYLEKGEAFDKNGLVVSDWRPVLEVYAE